MAVLIGREGPVETLESALRSAIGGAGRLVLLIGEAGIGKSRLADATAALAAVQSVPVARGYAVDDPGAPPLWPWLRVAQGSPSLTAVLGTGGQLDPTDAVTRFQRFVAVADELRRLAEPAGLLIVLEDLHWADRSSVLLLRHLVAELGGTKVLLLGTFRDVVEAPIAEVVPELLRGEHAVGVNLTGLHPADIATWLRRTPGLAGWAAAAPEIHRRTAGNPLLVRLVIDALPTGDADLGSLDAVLAQRSDLRRVVLRRSAALSDPATEVIAAASAIAERIHPEVLAVVTGRSMDDVAQLLAEAVRGAVLRTDDDGLSFVHALVRDAIYGQLAADVRAELHRRTAVALTTLAGPAGLIAGHWARAAGADARAAGVQWARRAMADARTVLAHDEAVRFAQLATDQAVAAGLSPAERAELLLDLISAHIAAGHLGPALQLCEDAVSLAENAERADLMAAVCLSIQGFGSINVARVMRRLCERTLSWFTDGGTTRARLLAQVVVAAAEDNFAGDAEPLSVLALAAAERTGDPVAILEAIAARHLTISVPASVDERMQLAERAIELGSRSDRPMAELWGHLWRIEAAFQLGDLGTVDRELVQVESVARRHRSVIARWHHHRLNATRAALVGDFAAARSYTEAAFALAVEMEDESVWGMYFAFLSKLAHIRGDPAVVDLDTMLRALKSAPAIPLVRIELPMTLAVHGRLDDARSAFEEFRELPGTLPVGLRWAATISEIGSLAVMLDDAPVAAAVYRLMLPYAGYCTGDGSGAVISFGSNARFVADLALTAGLHDEALRLYAEAVAVNIGLGARPFVALSRLGWARALTARLAAGRPASSSATGDRELAAKLAGQAAAEFRRLDMPGPLRTADDLLRDLTTRRRQLNPLSERETEVAGLIAEALSNREIASRLQLSERTVESHVRNILAKLGFASRTEIATWAVRSR